MRSFTIVKIISSDLRVNPNNVSGGRFISADPASAAKKAGSAICRQNVINLPISFKIFIKETTQSSDHKIYVYKFSRIYNPRIIMRSGKQITYEFENKVKSLKNKSVRRDGNFARNTLIAGDPAGIFDSRNNQKKTTQKKTTDTDTDTDVINPIIKFTDPDERKKKE